MEKPFLCLQNSSFKLAHRTVMQFFTITTCSTRALIWIQELQMSSTETADIVKHQMVFQHSVNSKELAGHWFSGRQLGKVQTESLRNMSIR